MNELDKNKLYVPGIGPHLAPKLMIIGECPSMKDVHNKRPFSDSRELDYLLLESGIRKEECWLTNVFKNHLPLHPLKTKRIPGHVRAKNAGIDVDGSIKELQEEVNQVQPNCILAIGATALWALTGKENIVEQRGSIIQGMGRKSVATYNPNHLNYNVGGAEFIGYFNRQIILFDLKRANQQSQFSDFRLPIRHLEVVHSSQQMFEFQKMYKSYPDMSVDIEALGTCLPGCIGFAFSKSHGLTLPLWNESSLSTMHDVELAKCWQIAYEMIWEKNIIGQNFNYDRDKIRRIGFIIRCLKSDTLLKAFTINPELPKRLAFNTSIYTEEPFYKDEGMYQGSPNDLFIGCARDSCVTFEVNEAMEQDLIDLNQHKFFYNFIMKLPEFYLGIENQGFRIDPAQRDLLLEKYVKWSETLQYELFKLTGEDVNLNSPKQVAILLFEVLKCPHRSGTGEEEITAMLNLQSFTDPMKRRVCELMLEKRRVDKSISTYLHSIPDYDGRMRTTYFPCLETGRSSTGQQDEPIRPGIEYKDLNGKKKKRSMGTAFQTITKHGDIGADIRSQFIPDIVLGDLLVDPSLTEDDIEVFVQADSSQAEARVVFLLADDEQALEDIDKHDYHALTATWFFGGVESDYSKKVLGYESPIRFAGKTLRHACHLAAGKRRAASELNTQARKYKIPITINESKADQAIKIFHAKQPKIQRVFHAGVINAVNSNRRLTAGLPYGIDADCGGIRTFYERAGDELNRQSLSYIPQRSISDNTKAAGLRIKKIIPEIKIVMESHDALLFCMKRSKVPSWGQIIKIEMERPISFHKCTLARRYLKIPCELEVGDNYESLKKFKFEFDESLNPTIPKRQFKVS